MPSRSRRVLVLNQFALPRSSPGGTRHVELFGQLDGWEATIVAGRRNMHDQSPVANEGALRTVPVTPYRGNGPSRVLNWASYTAAATVRGLAHRRWDVVYGSSPHLGAALAAWLVARAHRARFVLEVRDLWPQILADSGVLPETATVYQYLKAVEQFLYRQADSIVVLAKGSMDAIAANGIDRQKLHFLPNGADPASFAVAESREVLRARYGFTGTVAIYAGAHGPANGLHLLLDAAERLARTDVRIVLLGDGIEKRQLQDEAARRRLTNVYFRDPVPKDTIPELFAAADIGIHCLADVPLFRHGVSPNKLYDYMAAGLPVITNTPGEVAAMVKEAGAGQAVDPDDLAHGIHRLLVLSQRERAELGDNGRRWMAANRSRQAMAQQLEDVLS